jgi:hypothetical protein
LVTQHKVEVSTKILEDNNIYFEKEFKKLLDWVGLESEKS